jgi:hypothetical protein
VLFRYGLDVIGLGKRRALLQKFGRGYVPACIERMEGVFRQLESLLQHRDDWDTCLKDPNIIEPYNEYSKLSNFTSYKLIVQLYVKLFKKPGCK